MYAIRSYYASYGAPFDKGFRWQRLDIDLVGDIIEDTEGRIYALDLGGGISENDYLAVVYAIRDQFGEGAIVAQVGDDPNLPGAVPRRRIPGDDA